MSKAVILIIAHKSDPSPTELASLSQCFRILGNYPIVMICPEGLNVSAYRQAVPEVNVDFIDPKWQATYAMFNRLKIDPFLYRRYCGYEYILFYELDAWVFKDELMYWCDQEYDFIGAPWFEHYGAATESSRPLGVGNGGFSLRKVGSHLRALHSFSYTHDPREWIRVYRQNRKFKSFVEILENFTIRNNTFFLFNNYQKNEDLFWGSVVRRNFRWFRVPDIDTASRFSMEVNAPALYAKHNHQLPFGCHKWEKYHTSFWREFITVPDPGKSTEAHR